MKVDTEVVSVSDEFRKTLSSHLVLIYTGKTRLARNLLQNVVRNWYARDPALVANADALVANAERSFQVPARQQRRVCARTDRRVPVARRDCCAHTRACVLFFFLLLACFLAFFGSAGSVCGTRLTALLRCCRGRPSLCPRCARARVVACRRSKTATCRRRALAWTNIGNRKSSWPRVASPGLSAGARAWTC